MRQYCAIYSEVTVLVKAANPIFRTSEKIETKFWMDITFGK
jgi:hypothetical protein